MITTHPYIIRKGFRWRWYTPRWKVYLHTIDKGPVMQARFVYRNEADEYIERMRQKYYTPAEPQFFPMNTARTVG